MTSLLSFLKNLISPDDPQEDLWDELEKETDDFLQRLHIEELCSNVTQNSNDPIDLALTDHIGDDEITIQYSEIKEGFITAVKKDGGVINNVYLCRSEDVLPHIIHIGDEVLFRTVVSTDTDENNEDGEALFVKVEKIIPKGSEVTLDVLEPSELLGKPCDLSRKISGKITDKRVSSIIIDNIHTIDLNSVKCEVILEKGDSVSVECSADINTGEILEYKLVEPSNRKFLQQCVITCYNPDLGIGIIKCKIKNGTNLEVPFCKTICKPGYIPILDDVVYIEAIESDQEFFQWRAIHLELTKRAKSLNVSTNSANTGPAMHEAVSAMTVSENKFNIRNLIPNLVKIEIRNSSSRKRQLLAVLIDNQSRNSGHIISQLRVLRPSDPKYTKIPCTIPPNGYVEFTLEVLPKFLGKSCEKVTFILDDRAELSVPVELQVFIDGFDNNKKGPRRYQKKKLYTTEDICFRDSLQEVIRGVRPYDSSMKFKSVRIGPYDIPERLIVACRGSRVQPVTQSQVVTNLRQNYGVLFEQLSEANYLSKFHTCLFMEEIFLISHMANLDISKGVLRHAGDYLSLYVVGLMESRPSLIIGDRVYASVPDNVNVKNKTTYEGYIHSIRNEELYIKFSPAFHQSYKGESYAFRFVHSRTQFRRLHHVLDDIARPKLGIDWLFPKTIQEKAPVVHLVDREEEEEISRPDYLNTRPELLSEKLRRIFPGAQGDNVTNEKENTPILNNEKENTSILNNKKENTPILNNEKENTPILNNEKENKPILNNEKENTPILNNEKENTPILNNEKENTPMMNNEKNTNKKELYKKFLNTENANRPKIKSPPRSDKNNECKKTKNEAEVVNHNQITTVLDAELCNDVSKKEFDDIKDSCSVQNILNEENTDRAIITAIVDSIPPVHSDSIPLDNTKNAHPKKSKVTEKLNWGKVKHNSDLNWTQDAIGMGISKPSSSSSITNILMREKEVNWFNKDLNWHQKAAVKNILKFQARPLPYILFGPPGTGKTVTVTETVLQLYTLIPESRIILATPNNASADLLTEKLIESGLFQIGDIVRLLSYNYLLTGSVPANIAPYSCLLSDKHLNEYSEILENSGGVTSQSRESLLKYRLVVSTCAGFGQLLCVGTPTGYFTHCIVDEAGQASEPEVLVPISLLHRDNGHVVLAGDPLQLGPCVFSKIGQQLELATSLLERITSRFLYSRDVNRFFQTGGYDPRLVTRLVDNYRTMPEILKIASDLFYDSSLIPHVTQDDYEGLILRKLSKILPGRSSIAPHPSPILFHGVVGENSQDRDSPSWYNNTEAVVVVSYLKKLFDAGMRADQIGVITPYKKQVSKIRSLITGCGIAEPKVASIEEFQGQERLVIILSTVRSLACSKFLPKDIEQCLGFIGLPNRLNVAITRARAVLLIVGDPNLLSEDLHWEKIIAYVHSIGGYTGCMHNNANLKS